MFFLLARRSMCILLQPVLESCRGSEWPLKPGGGPSDQHPSRGLYQLGLHSVVTGLWLWEGGLEVSGVKGFHLGV